MLENLVTEKEAVTSDTIQHDEQPVDIEHAKLRQDKELREKELALKEQELGLQREQNSRNRWSTPAVVAIVAGLVGYVGTLISNYQNRQLERDKQEGTLILEAIKTAGTSEEKEKLTAANLVFLADAGLITSIKKEALDKLRAKAGSAVPSLPAAQPLDFKRSSSLTSELQSKLQSAVAGYESYLAKIGYDPGQAKDRITVEVDEQNSENAYFDTAHESIGLGANLARSPEYVLAEYTWNVLQHSNPTAYQLVGKPTPNQFPCFAQGLKLYLASSYLDSPYFGANYWSLVGLTPPPGRDPRYLFNLKELKPFDKNGGPSALEQHLVGQIWASAFWELRESFGRDKADRLIFATWKRLNPAEGDANDPNFFVKTMIETGDSSGYEADAREVRQAFDRRKLH
jgi:hypothetical protein